MRPRWIVQAERAFANARQGFAFKLKREALTQRAGVGGEVAEAFRTQRGAIDEAEQTKAALTGLPHQLHRDAAHGVARIDFDDGFESGQAGGVAIDESVNPERAEIVGATEFRFQQRKEVRVKLQKVV